MSVYTCLYIILLNIAFTCAFNALRVPVLDTLNFPGNFSSENEECNRHFEILREHLQNNTLWAYKMWDASAKIAVGLTEGSQYQLGDFDECLSIKEPFSTQYCLATIYLEIEMKKTVQDPFSMEYKPYINLYEKLDKNEDKIKLPRNEIFWGLCVPNSCSAENIKIELQKYLNTQNQSFIKQYNVQIDHKDCQYNRNGYEMTTLDLLFYFIVGFFVCIVFISTIYHIQYHNTENGKKKTTKLLLCFSAKENFQDLGKSESNKRMDILYGVKFYLMFCIIGGHSLTITLTGAVFNFHEIEKINRTPMFMFICKGDLIVDVFFLIGGLLNTYLFLIQTNKNNYNPIKSIILRYFRSMPIFALITLFYITLLYKTGSGPLWSKLVGVEKEYCEKNWWTNLLLLNNYINFENMCILQGWYLGAEFQMFVLSIPLNYLIKKNNKSSWTILILILFICILTPFLIIYIGEKDPVTSYNTNYFVRFRMIDNIQTLYVPAHTRMAAYIIGMISGFIYFKLRNSELKISFVSSMLLLMAASLIIMACILIALIFYNPYIPYNAFYIALYGSFNRPIFALASSVILFVLSFGSIPNQLFTWKPLIPLSKLMFGAYLIHFAFQVTKVASQRAPVIFTQYYLSTQSFMEGTLSLMTSFVLYIFIEMPCAKFMKEIINSCKQNKIESKNTDNK